LGRALERARDGLGAGLSEDPVFEVHRIAGLGDVLRPAPALARACALPVRGSMWHGGSSVKGDAFHAARLPGRLRRPPLASPVGRAPLRAPAGRQRPCGGVKAGPMHADRSLPAPRLLPPLLLLAAAAGAQAQGTSCEE